MEEHKAEKVDAPCKKKHCTNLVAKNALHASMSNTEREANSCRTSSTEDIKKTKKRDRDDPCGRGKHGERRHCFTSAVNGRTKVWRVDPVFLVVYHGLSKGRHCHPEEIYGSD